MSSAKELKEKAKSGYKYYFNDESFDKFCRQLCKEQREICAEIINQEYDNTVGFELVELIINAKMPEL